MQKIIHFFFIPLSVLLLLTVFSYACKDNGTNPQDKEFVLPDSNLTYTDDVGPMLIAKCGSNSGCHNPSDKAGGLDITNYTEIVTHWVTGEFGAEKLVVPGSGSTSFLYRVLLDNLLETPRMPLNGPFLNSNNINGVKVWIDEGAVFSSE